MAACASMTVCIGLFIHWMLAVPLIPISVSVGVPDAPEAVVVLDAGHGGEDCGAIGISGVLEKNLNLAITQMLATQLRAAGVQVVETRTEDRLLYDPSMVQPGHKKSEDLVNRAAYAERYPSAVFVSIHMNSFPMEKYSGLQVWYGQGNENGKRLANDLQNAVREKLQPDNHRTVKASNGSMYLLDHISCPTVLIECGFLSNRAECEKLSTEEYQKELSFILFCVMMEYLNTEESGLI